MHRSNRNYTSTRRQQFYSTRSSKPVTPKQVVAPKQPVQSNKSEGSTSQNMSPLMYGLSMGVGMMTGMMFARSISSMIVDKKLNVSQEQQLELENLDNIDERFHKCEQEFIEFNESNEVAQEKWEALIACMKK